MKNCKVCGDKTEVVFNIYFKATPICESCATAIFLQQAVFYTQRYNQDIINEPIHNTIYSSSDLGSK